MIDPITITVAQHVRDLDGTVRLTLRLVGPLPDDPLVVLVDVDGEVSIDGDDVLIGWVWPPAMVPPDPPSFCAAHVRRVVTAWAAGYAAPQGLVMTDEGTVV